MATEIKMPKLGESVTEGTIGKWLKRPGERVEKYEALLEVTTDKVDTEVPAPEGTTVRVGTLLAVLENDGDRTENQERAPAGSTSANGSENSELRTQSQALEPFASLEGKLREGSELSTRTSLSQSYSGPISPVVARLASEHQLDLGKIEGTGQGGRITKQDVLKYLELRKAQPAAKTDAKASGEIMTEAPAQPTREPALQEAALSGPSTEAPAEPPRLMPPMATTAPTTSPAAFEIPDDAE